jgi:hypothetical protein
MGAGACKYCGLLTDGRHELTCPFYVGGDD